MPEQQPFQRKTVQRGGLLDLSLCVYAAVRLLRTRCGRARLRGKSYQLVEGNARGRSSKTPFGTVWRTGKLFKFCSQPRSAGHMVLTCLRGLSLSSGKKSWRSEGLQLNSHTADNTHSRAPEGLSTRPCLFHAVRLVYVAHWQRRSRPKISCFMHTRSRGKCCHAECLPLLSPGSVQ